MAKLLNDIEWSSPLLSVPLKDYGLELSRRMDPWLQEAAASVSRPVQFSYATPRLVGISQLVTAQENACHTATGSKEPP